MEKNIFKLYSVKLWRPVKRAKWVLSRKNFLRLRNLVILKSKSKSSHLTPLSHLTPFDGLTLRFQNTLVKAKHFDLNWTVRVCIFTPVSLTYLRVPFTSAILNLDSQMIRKCCFIAFSTLTFENRSAGPDILLRTQIWRNHDVTMT